jgi:hypothetical protein
MWHVANGEFPFRSRERDELPKWTHHAIQDHDARLVPIVKSMMCLDMAQRPSSAQCEESFKTYINSRIEKKQQQQKGPSNRTLWMALGAAVLAPKLLIAGHAVVAGHAAAAGYHGDRSQAEMGMIQAAHQAVLL